MATSNVQGSFCNSTRWLTLEHVLTCSNVNGAWWRDILSIQMCERPSWTNFDFSGDTYIFQRPKLLHIILQTWRHFSGCAIIVAKDTKLVLYKTCHCRVELNGKRRLHIKPHTAILWLYQIVNCSHPFIVANGVQQPTIRENRNAGWVVKIVSFLLITVGWVTWNGGSVYSRKRILHKIKNSELSSSADSGSNGSAVCSFPPPARIKASISSLDGALNAPCT